MTLPHGSAQIAPWLDVSDPYAALAFYKQAFDAVETYHMEDPGGGLVVRLSILGAEFWVSGGAPGSTDTPPPPLGGRNLRLILTTNDPDEVFERALAAGANEIYPVQEEHGWKIGRLEDPFGLHWEVGIQLGND